MTQRVRISFCIVCLPFICGAQIKQIDSMSFEYESKQDTIKESNSFTGTDNINKKANLPWRYYPETDLAFNYKISRPSVSIAQILSVMSGQSTVFSWTNGEALTTGSTAVYPGLMKVQCGSIGISQKGGDFMFYAGGIVNKYGYFQGLHTQYGIHGSLTYQVSPKVSLKAFGTYFFGKQPAIGRGLPMPPAMTGYYDVSKYGAYVNYDAGDRFGIFVGGQAERQIGTNRYEAQPIVTPYLKIGNGKSPFAIPLPIGQILYGILKR